ncbi:MAG: hypothetical protein QM599_04195 [Pseudoxanthomonas sp.]
MLTVLFWCAGIYLLIGLCMATLGPLGRDIRRELRNLKHGPMASTGFGCFDRVEPYTPPSRWKRFLFVAVMGVGAILGWGIFLADRWSRDRAERKLAARLRAEDERRMAEKPPPVPRGLLFSRCSGAGELHCRTCGHSEWMVSFLHGFGENSWSRTGYQCRACARLCGIDARQNDPKPDLHCTCGGELTRDEPIICPACRSPDVWRGLGIIT